MFDYRIRKHQRSTQHTYHIKVITLAALLLIVVFSRYARTPPGNKTALFVSPSTAESVSTVSSDSDAESVQDVRTTQEASPLLAVPPDRVSEPKCIGYSGSPDPTYPMHNGYIDWDAYWDLANAYAIQRTAEYSDEERMLATVIWAEQKTEAATPTERIARHRAMIAIGYVILHRRDKQDGWFGSTSTLTEVLTDTRQDVQFQGYWVWHERDVVQDHIIRKVESGTVIQSGLGWESPDRGVWFEALDVARSVLRGCPTDMMPDSLYFGHGASAGQVILQRAAEDSTFTYRQIRGAGLWLTNKPFRR